MKLKMKIALLTMVLAALMPAVADAFQITYENMQLAQIAYNTQKKLLAEAADRQNTENVRITYVVQDLNTNTYLRIPVIYIIEEDRSSHICTVKGYGYYLNVEKQTYRWMEWELPSGRNAGFKIHGDFYYVVDPMEGDGDVLFRLTGFNYPLKNLGKLRNLSFANSLITVRQYSPTDLSALDAVYGL